MLSIIFTQNTAAESNLEERINLILLSQKLQNKEYNNNYSNYNHKFGLVFSNYGSNEKLLNPGVILNLHLFAPADKEIQLIAEGYYLREKEEMTAFLSIAFFPFKTIYLGLGAEVTGDEKYQFFVGKDLTNKIFLELKRISLNQNFEGSETYFSGGIKFEF